MEIFRRAQHREYLHICLQQSVLGGESCDGSEKPYANVILVEAGVQEAMQSLDSSFHRNDGQGFCDTFSIACTGLF
jgi:hypothetical protein